MGSSGLGRHRAELEHELFLPSDPDLMVKGWGAGEYRTAIAIAIRTGDRRMMKAAATRSIAYFTANCQLLGSVGSIEMRAVRRGARWSSALHRLEEPWDERNRDAEILAPASDPQEDVMGCGRERDHGMLDGVFCHRSRSARAENGDGQGAVSVKRGSLSR